MKTLMIERMNKENQLRLGVIEVIKHGISDELAELKANEIMRVFGYSYSRMSADDLCPYCHELKMENGECACVQK